VKQTSNTRMRLHLDPRQAALYLNVTDRYACPCYSDRADLIAPELNRVAQFLRTFGVTIILYTSALPPTPFPARFRSLRSRRTASRPIRPVFAMAAFLIGLHDRARRSTATSCTRLGPTCSRIRQIARSGWQSTGGCGISSSPE
jgi:hypothetical protein